MIIYSSFLFHESYQGGIYKAIFIYKYPLDHTKKIFLIAGQLATTTQKRVPRWFFMMFARNDHPSSV